MSGFPSWLTEIRLPMPATLGEVNVYLVRGPGGVALIDTGMNDAASRKELVSSLGAQRLEMSDVDKVVSTHHHADHAGLGKSFEEAGAVTMMSEEDAESLRIFFDRPDLDTSRASFYGRHEVPVEFAQKVGAVFPFFRGMSERFEPSVRLVDGQEVDLGGIRFVVLVTPGHTPGHLCLFQREEAIVLTGDCVIANDATHMSMRQEAQGTDPVGLFIGSLERIRDLGPVVGLPGHGPRIQNLPERADQLIRHHQARLERIRSVLGDEPRAAFDISSEVMGPRPKLFAKWLALSQTLAYLERLVLTGDAEQVDTEAGVRYRKAL